MPRSSHNIQLMLLAFFAGATGLLYEIAFARLLTPVLGNSPAASLATLAAFTVGVAIGGRLFGGLSDRTKDPLLLFIILECIAALFALTLPLLAGVLPSFVPALVLSTSETPESGFATRFMIAFVLLALPGVVLGGTLPPLIRRGLASGEARLSWLYGANTLGAATGAALGGLFLLQRFGLRASCHSAAMLDALLALAAFVVARRGRHNPGAMGKAPELPESATPPWVLILLVASTGFTTLALEVVWIRVLPFTLGNGLHVLPFLLTTVLAGLGGGAWIDAVLTRRGATDQGWDLTVRILITVLTIPLCLKAATLLFLSYGFYLFTPFASPVANAMFNRAIHASVAVLLPSIALGTVFPAAARLRCRNSNRMGRQFGATMAASALGLMAGGLITPVFLIPSIGAEGTAHLLGAVLMVAALVIVATTRPRTRLRQAIVAALTLAAATTCLVVPRDSILRLVHRDNPRLAVRHYQETTSSTVAVVQDRSSGIRHLSINGVGEVPDTLYGLQAFRMLGHLPVMLHPKPRAALMITFGGGIAAGTLLGHPLERLDVVDIEAGVFGANRQFSHVNHRPLEDPRLKTHVQDGRNYLLAHLARGGRTFDLIVSDATHPGSGDSWVLYTREFYTLCRRGLSRGGLMVQWLPMHAMSVEAYLSVLATLSSVFKYCTVWLLGEHSLIVGAAKPIRIDRDRLAQQLRRTRVAADLKQVGLGDLASLLDSLVAGPGTVKFLARAVPLTTDNLPWAAVVQPEIDSMRKIAQGLLNVRAKVESSPLHSLGVHPSGRLARRLQCLAKAAPLLNNGQCDAAQRLCPNEPKVRLCFVAGGQRAP